MVSEEKRSGLTVQLVPVQVLGPGIALPTTLVWTLKLLVESFPTPPALPRGACCLTAIFVVSLCFVAISSTSSTLAVGRGRGGRLDWAARGVHLLGELCLDHAAKVGRVPCVQ